MNLRNRASLKRTLKFPMATIQQTEFEVELNVKCCSYITLAIINRIVKILKYYSLSRSSEEVQQELSADLRGRYELGSR